MGSLPALPDALAGLGALGLLAWLVFRTMNHSFYDRQWYQDQLSKLQEEHDKEIDDLREQHRDEIDNVRQQSEDRTRELGERLAELQERVRELQDAIEAARRSRWAAEDAASKWRRAAIAAGVPDDHVAD